MSKLSD